MSVDTEPSPHSFEGEPSLSDAIEKLEIERQKLFAASEHYLRRPSIANQKSFCESVGQTARALYEPVSLLFADETADVTAVARSVSTFLVSDDQERVTFFNKLASSDKFQPDSSGEEWEATVIDLLESGIDADMVASGMVDAYIGTNIEIDAEKFLEIVASSRRAQLLKHSKVIGRHAVDVAKMSAAVAVGIMITRKRR